MSRAQINASATPADVDRVDALQSYLRRRQRTRASRGQAVLWSVEQVHRSLADEIAVDVAAWSRLVARVREIEPVGDPLAAKIILVGEGENEIAEDIHTTPTGATIRTPARWERMTATAMVPPGLGIDATTGEPLALPLLVEAPDNPYDLAVTVFATDESQQARIYLGPLIRVVGEEPWYSRRLSSIAEDNGFPA